MSEAERCLVVLFSLFRILILGVPVISIIDDDDSVREATKGLVRSLGYGVATFASAEGFLQSNEINDTECVISDVQMPGLSGVELQSQLIADGKRTPIIFITASLEERTRAGAEGWRNWRPEQALQRGVAYAVAGSLNCCGK